MDAILFSPIIKIEGNQEERNFLIKKTAVYILLPIYRISYI
jgi:hypothetical protein